MNKITIHGFYGHGNLGDEAILKALLQEFNKFSNIKLVIFSDNPKQVSMKHGVKSVHSQGRRSFLHRIWEIKTSNLFILGGGGLLKDYGNNSSNIEKWLKLLQLAEKLKVKTALCAIGVENIRYNDSKILLKDTLDKADLITVRDSNSKYILKDIGVRNEVKVVMDPSVLLTYVDPSKTKDISMPPKVIICVRHWFNKGFYIEKPETNENFIRSLSTAVDFLVENYNAIIDLIPMRTTHYDDDRVVSNQVLSYMKHKDGVHVHSRAPEVDEFIEMAKQSSLIIGMRLHSLILGASVGVPVIGLEYMPKVKAFMDSINQSDYSLGLETITSDSLIGLIEDTFKRYNTRCKAICLEVSSLQKIIRKSISELISLANSKR